MNPYPTSQPPAQEPTEEERRILNGLHDLAAFSWQRLYILRAHVAAEVAKATAECVKVITACNQWIAEAKPLLAKGGEAERSLAAATERAEKVTEERDNLGALVSRLREALTEARPWLPSHGTHAEDLINLVESALTMTPESAGKKLAELRAEVERLDPGVHSCGPDCQRPMCVLRRENAELRQWKKEQFTVTAWWEEIDNFIRTHPDAPLGRSVSQTALAWLKERDELRADKARLEWLDGASYSCVEPAIFRWRLHFVGHNEKDIRAGIDAARQAEARKEQA